jgi:hypothetical protein
VNEDLSPGANYRTILDCVSWHHMTVRDGGGGGMDRCPRDLPSVVEAIASEIGAGLRWGFDVTDNASLPRVTAAETYALCQNTWNLPSDVTESENARVNRLYGNEPNPFNPRTTVRYAIAEAGKVELKVYDVNGRLVRTLVNAREDAGLHAVVWDGRNDAGQPVGSGVFWTQMRTGAFVSNKKMVVLK